MTDEGRIGALEEKVEDLLRKNADLKQQVVTLQQQIRVAQGGAG